MQTFHDLGIDAHIVKALDSLSITTPTEIQQKTIPVLLGDPTDFLGLARTGSGKTAAFGIPLIEKIDGSSDKVQAIVLSPTRELAQQIEEQLKAFSQHLKHIQTTVVYGGAPITAQIKNLKSNRPQIVVATPGRMIDLVNRKALQLQEVKWVVLDEADEMLNMGFKEDIDTILSSTGSEKHTWLFSATMPEDIRRIIKNYMHDYQEVGVGEKHHVNTDISHRYALVKKGDREIALQRLIDRDQSMYGLIFCRTKAETQRLATSMSDAGYAVDALHGDLSQAQRNTVMRKFKKQQTQLVAATDVAARGIDVDQLTHVIHYDLPDDLAFYTHRSGRTGRAGRKGIAISIIPPSELYKIEHLSRKLKIEFERERIPTLGEVKMKRVEHIVNEVMMAEASDEARSWVYSIQDHLEHLSKEELMAKLITRSLDAMSANGKDDINVESTRHREGKAKAPRARADRNTGDRKSNDRKAADARMVTFEINVGKKDQIKVGEILRLICDATGVRSRYIGRINMGPQSSRFDVDKSKASNVLPGMKGFSLNGRKIQVRQSS